MPNQPTVSIAECDANGNIISNPSSSPVVAGAEAYFLVSLSGNMPDNGCPVTVDYQVVNGTALAFTDYTPPNNDYGDQPLTFTYDSSTGVYDPVKITVNTTAGAPWRPTGRPRRFRWR